MRDRLSNRKLPASVGGFWVSSVLLGIFISLLGWSGTRPSPNPSPSAPGPHGGRILKSRQTTAELKIDAPRKRIHIYLPKGTDKAPAGVNVILYDQDNRPTSFDLNRVDPSVSEPMDMTHYQGELGPNQGSFMGVQVSIPFTKGEPTVIEERNLDQ